MSIEASLTSIAKSLETIAAHLSNSTPKAPSAPVVAAPVVPTPAPVLAPTPPAPVAAPVVTAPVASAPVVAPTATVPPSSGAPFTDAKGMITYVMSAYTALGPKGQAIQGVLQGLGVVNINEVRPDQYAALYAGVEALK